MIRAERVHLCRVAGITLCDLIRQVTSGIALGWVSHEELQAPTHLYFLPLLTASLQRLHTKTTIHAISGVLNAGA